MMSRETLPAETVPAGDAAKLILLERVGGAVGDDLLSHLQPMLLLQELLRATLAKPETDAAALWKHTEWIRPVVQLAMRASTAAVEWLRPLTGACTPSVELAAECAALLRPEFELCGLRLQLESEGDALPIDRARGRTMLCAALAHAGDHASEPAEILVKLKHRSDACEVRITRRPATGAVPADFLKTQQRPLSWNDLLALADREAVLVRREDDGTIVLELAASAKGTPPMAPPVPGLA